MQLVFDNVTIPNQFKVQSNDLTIGIITGHKIISYRKISYVYRAVFTPTKHFLGTFSDLSPAIEAINQYYKLYKG